MYDLWPVRDHDFTRMTRQGSTTIPVGWQGNVGYRKSALDYTTLWRAFRNSFLLKIFSCVIRNTMIVNIIRFWKPLSSEFTYKVINNANIVHTYFSFLTFSVHSQFFQEIIKEKFMMHVNLLQATVKMGVHIYIVLILISHTAHWHMKNISESTLLSRIYIDSQTGF